jgi:hypothetical protein
MRIYFHIHSCADMLYLVLRCSITLAPQHSLDLLGYITWQLLTLCTFSYFVKLNLKMYWRWTLLYVSMDGCLTRLIDWLEEVSVSLSLL